MKNVNKDIYLIADNIRSLFNVGSIFRCADVFAVKKIYLCGYTGSPPRKEISKTALYADTWLPWEKHLSAVSVVEKLKKENIQIIALETGEDSLAINTFQPQFPLAIIIGNEVDGISDELLKLADTKIKIPMIGHKESLNVSVATSIALYDFRNKTNFI